MVKYLGSKRALVPLIAAVVERLPVRSAVDLFSGTTRVGQALRLQGLHVHSNDLATYSEQLGLAYIAADETLDRERIRRLLAHLHQRPPKHGYFTETFCTRSRFVQPHNGRRIDAIRDEIERLDLTPVERGVLMTSLLEAADRVDSTCGVQMAYVKSWAQRSYKDLELREPHHVPGPAGTVTRADANALAPHLDGIDLAYIDPPYNQHSYFSNYHVWETLVRWDKPDHYGVACKRTDCRTTKSPYNSKARAADALTDLIESLPTPWLIVSASDEGFHDPGELTTLLSQRGYVHSATVENPRYVGARIGIHNPQGERVGQISHVRNHESILVCGPQRLDAGLGLEALAA